MPKEKKIWADESYQPAALSFGELVGPLITLTEQGTTQPQCQGCLVWPENAFKPGLR